MQCLSYLSIGLEKVKSKKIKFRYKANINVDDNIYPVSCTFVRSIFKIFVNFVCKMVDN